MALHQQDRELDASYSLPGRARFRVNGYYQRDSMGAAFRLIPTAIRSVEELGLPPNVADVYVNDPDAFPAQPCEGCDYLLPMQSKLRAEMPGVDNHRRAWLARGRPCQRPVRANKSRSVRLHPEDLSRARNRRVSRSHR